MCTTTNQPDTQSNPNPNPTTKQHESNKHSTEYTFYVSREIHTGQCYCTVFVVTVTLSC